MAKKKVEAVEKEIVIKPIKTQTVKVTIEGDSDLILNCMNKRTTEELIDKKEGKGKTIREVNKWEDIITSIHWRDDLPENIEYTEKTLRNLLKTNAPCITTHGLKESFADAVVRNELDKYKTKFKAGVNVISPGGYVPIEFAEYHIDKRLMAVKNGGQSLEHKSRFSGWRATFTVRFMEGGTFSLDRIVQVIDLAGFGLGIGSGRNSDFGRYHVVGVE